MTKRPSTRKLRMQTAETHPAYIAERAVDRLLDHGPVLVACLRALKPGKNVLSGLSYREREIIKLRCGVGSDGYSYTLEEVGHIFKVTRERIRGIQNKAIRKLGRQLMEVL